MQIGDRIREARAEEEISDSQAQRAPSVACAIPLCWLGGQSFCRAILLVRVLVEEGRYYMVGLSDTRVWMPDA